MTGGVGDPPSRSTPWVNLAGGGWPDQFYAGGQIDGAGIEIDHVQLRFAEGVILEDDADKGIALFITDDDVQLPAIVALFDSAGAEVASHPLPGH